MGAIPTRVPKVTPKDFQIVEDSINATSVIFTWEGVSEEPEIMQGHLTAYDIIFWKTDDPENKRIHTVSVHPFDPCPLVRSRERRQLLEQWEEHVFNLWSFSNISAGIRVKNSKHSGPLSEPSIQFETPEGVPGRVAMFEVEERGPNHFLVSWDPPLETNGVLLEFTIGYRLASDPDAEIYNHHIDNPLKRVTEIQGLRPETQYILYISARTRAGPGDLFYLEDKTVAAGSRVGNLNMGSSKYRSQSLDGLTSIWCSTTADSEDRYVLVKVSTMAFKTRGIGDFIKRTDKH